MMLFLTYIIVIIQFSDYTDALVKCEGKTYYWARKESYICCGTRLLWKRNMYVTCCGSRAYSPSSQGCCAGQIYRRKDINSGCCYGKPFQRGSQSCCGKKVIDIKNQGCCRNVPFDKGYAACCNGIKTPNDDFQTNKDPKCCGSHIYNPRYRVCCAQKIAPNVAGRFTRCCKTQSYDIRKESCCHKVIPNRSKRGEACCIGEMIKTNTHICCGYGPMAREPGEDNACCKIGQYEYVMYDKNKQICCSEKVQPKKGEETACCVREAYDVNRQICCNEELYGPYIDVASLRCCASGPYDRNKNICCENKLFLLPKKAKKYTFCCGTGIYDRRKYECRFIARKGYQLFSLNRENEYSL